MRFVVLWTCHILMTLTLSAVGFCVGAVITHHLITSAVCAGLAGLAAFFLASRYALIAIGPRVLDPEADATTGSWRIRRGHPLQSNQDIFKRIAARTQTPGRSSDQCVPWSGMMIPADLLAPHTKPFGMTRSRKTITIRLILQELVDRATPANNIKIIVFDPKREFYRDILRMDPLAPVLLFDGTDPRGFAWDMAVDITEPNHAKSVAKMFVPDEQSIQPYCSRAARRILEWVIRHLIDHADHWNLQDVFVILKDLAMLRQILPPNIIECCFTHEGCLKNTLSTLDALTSRFETIAACWAHAEKAGRTISLTQFEALSTSAILVIPRRLDIADAIDPMIRLIFERLIRLWLARPDTGFLPPDCRPETYVILDETAKAGSLARLDDIVLMRAKGVSVVQAAQDISRNLHG
jgi:hypothetical protein